MASRDASGVASSICLAKQADLEAVAFSCTGRRLARAAYGLGLEVSSITFLMGFFTGILSTIRGLSWGHFSLILGHFNLILGPFQPYLGAISALSWGHFSLILGTISILSWGHFSLILGSYILSWSFLLPRPFLEVLDEPLEVARQAPKTIPKHALNAPKALRKPVSGRQIFQPYPGPGKSEIRGRG